MMMCLVSTVFALLSSAHGLAVDSQVRSLLRADQQAAVVRRALAEQALLARNTLLCVPESPSGQSSPPRLVGHAPIKKKRAVGGGSGFGKKSESEPASGAPKSSVVLRKRKPLYKPQKALAAHQAAVLTRDGCVRVDSAICRETAASLREFVLAEKAAADLAVAEGTSPMHARFADVLMRSNRCDLLLPLDGAGGTHAALSELFGVGGSLRGLYDLLVPPDGEFYECASLISEPGAQRQTVHSDAAFTKRRAFVTAFLALQDVTEEMGPTTFLLGSHLEEAHKQFVGPQKDAYLEGADARLALLKAGDIVVFDSRTLHCGGGNLLEGGSERVLFYFSVRDSGVPYEGDGTVSSMRPGYVGDGGLSIGMLEQYLDEGGGNPLGKLGDGLGGDEVVLARQKYAKERGGPAGEL